MTTSIGKDNVLRTDFHIHCLPDFDDGAENAEVSVEMLRQLHCQGVEIAVATPHYYPTNESVVEFLARREASVSRLRQRLAENAPGVPLPRLLIGAEVHLIQGLAAYDLSKLAYENTNHILLELPYAPYAPWMSEEIWNIASTRGLVPVLAHLDRYQPRYQSAEIDDLLEIPGICVQINAVAFEDGRLTRFVRDVFDRGRPVLLGSDAHGIDSRPPDFSAAFRCLAKKRFAPLLAHMRASDFLGI
jgi:protein-tyrosine phosphatase